MNAPDISAAIRLINDARGLNLDFRPYHSRIEDLLGRVVELLSPPRYVLSGAADHLFILDTQHPDYRPTDTLALSDSWVVVSWDCPSREARNKVRALVEHLNSTATKHENNT